MGLREGVKSRRPPNQREKCVPFLIISGEPFFFVLHVGSQIPSYAYIILFSYLGGGRI